MLIKEDERYSRYSSQRLAMVYTHRILVLFSFPNDPLQPSFSGEDTGDILRLQALRGELS